MFIKKGTILELCEINPELLKNKSKAERKRINHIKNNVKPKPIYFICLRKFDNSHFLCAPIINVGGKYKIPLELNTDENLWISCSTFYIIHVDFLKVKIQSNNYLFELVPDIYDNHELFIEKQLDAKTYNKALTRNMLAKKKRDRKYRKLHGNPNDPRTEHNPIEIVRMERGPTKQYNENAWSNVHHPASSGRGNF